MPRGSRAGKVRASGETQGAEVSEQQGKELDQPVEEQVLDTERQEVFEAFGLSRMRMDWRGDDAPMIARARNTVEGRITATFADAYAIMSDIYDVVRTPQIDDSGEIVRDQFGFPIWKRTVSGAFEEDWTRLSTRQKEDFLYRITTQLFEWEQRAADAWGEAMLAKAEWQERFAVEYDKPLVGTIDDRTAVGNAKSADERYFAIFLSWYSRKADAIVRSMQTLALRVRDTLS